MEAQTQTLYLSFLFHKLIERILSSTNNTKIRYRQGPCDAQGERERKPLKDPEHQANMNSVAHRGVIVTSDRPVTNMCWGPRMGSERDQRKPRGVCGSCEKYGPRVQRGPWENPEGSVVLVTNMGLSSAESVPRASHQLPNRKIRGTVCHSPSPSPPPTSPFSASLSHHSFHRENKGGETFLLILEPLQLAFDEIGYFPWIEQGQIRWIIRHKRLCFKFQIVGIFGAGKMLILSVYRWMIWRWRCR